MSQSLTALLAFISKGNLLINSFFSASYQKKHFAFIAVFAMLSYAPVCLAQNAIVAENALQGNPASEWDVSGAGDLSIQGFATDISVNKGETVHFKIKTDASSYSVSIYRLGYYNGNGARLVGNGTVTATLPQTQPADLYDAATGLTDCGNWSESAHWDVPSDAVSGIYIARLKRNNGGASHIVFIVRDDTSHSDLFFQTSDATWQAYNVYGGNSLYVGSTSYPGGHAAKVSYNRPFFTRNGGGGGGAAEDWLFNSEYPMLRWLERNGYNMSYTTDVDQARRGNLILNHKVFLSVGHDEYWSAEQRNSVEAARAAGVHLAFFCGNECYSKTRWEPSTDGSNTAYRTLVCYKEGTLGENQCNQKCDPLSGIWTGLWRDGDPAVYGANDGYKPENAMSGQISWDGTTGTIEVPDTYKNLRFWRNTSVANLAAGQTATLAANTLGYEWDWEQYENSYPAGRITMSSTTADGHTHKLSLYKHSSGALVFGAGTVQWSWGLDGTHDRGTSVPNTAMQQATVNLLADMNAQPATLQNGLVAATASTDVAPPVSAIVSPVNSASLPKGTAVTITGTATDAGGVVAGVEVSTDGGSTWHSATGTANWSYTFTPAAEGNVTIISRSTDDIGNMEQNGGETASNSITVSVTGAAPVNCPCTVFQPADGPSSEKYNDNSAIELGFKFQTSESGFITSIRFYKAAGDAGTHSGELWDSNGSLLASATFINESASGWQQAELTSPVAVTANTTYTASIFSSSGDYAVTNPFFTQSITNGPLTALANGNDGPNGVYKYTSSPAFPTSNYQTSNYWVDVVFNMNTGPDVTPPVIASTLPSNGAVGVNANTSVSIVFNEAIDESTINASTLKLLNETQAEVASSVSYNTSTHKATISPSSVLAYSKTYTVAIKGGTSDPRIKDIAGNALASDYTFTFTTANPPPPPPTEGTDGPILVISAASNPFSRYPVEILRAEGLNEFKAVDISQVNSALLDKYDVVIVGEIPLSASDVMMLTDWTNAGGTLITFRPDTKLASLLGITPASGNLADKYLLVNTNTVPGAGIVNESIQYHGTADLYTLNGAASLATLYSNATTATINPAVTINNVGSNGGIAVAFTYDLARSVVYTRQGNPAWAGQKRDGQIDPIRSDDMFFPDWIDFNKIAIPQADEQQHLLSNIILTENLHHKPLPKFWFLPKDFKAAIVMTGDDHGDAGMKPRFDINISESPVGCSVDDWECIRSTGYLYVGSTFTSSQAKQYTDLGFEVAMHVNTNCQNFTPGEYQNFITSQSSDFHTAFPDIPLPSTNRNHCIAFPDWSTVPETEAANGIRLDVNYYYWPDSWVQNRPGMFTGSGMPMRFAKIDGSLIDCYQAVTQMPDESGETFPQFCDALLDKAVGTQGYYGIFTTNMHFDNPNHAGANAIVASAKARGVPVVSAKQMLTWLDGRNNSSFGDLTWNGNTLNFTVMAAAGSRNMQGMLPVAVSGGQLSSITFNGSAVTIKKEVIKGIEYAFFPAASGNYAATYAIDNDAPVISSVIAMPHTKGTATITWTTNEVSDSKISFGTSANALPLEADSSSLTLTHSVIVSGLDAGVTYYFRVSSTDASNNTTTEPVAANAPLSFIMASAPCINDITADDFNAGTTDDNTLVALEGDGGVILKPLLSDEFSGTSLSSNFTAGKFTGDVTTVSNGTVTVDGTHIYSNSSFTPGSSLEFVATFNLGTYQNVGFSSDIPFNDPPWITIGQGGNLDGNLYARSSNGDALSLGSNLLGAPHHYRIQWNADNFEFYVDGNEIPAATINLSVTQNLYVQISDYNVNDGTLSADWLRVLPYASSGTYTSQVFDGGVAKIWGAVTWNAGAPTGTNVSIAVRKGNTPVPDESWTSFTPVAASGDNTNGTSRYIQYKADLQTANTSVTPVLQNISITCSAVTNTPPVITKQPASQTICPGNDIVFGSTATGNPAPTVQWQVSTDGNGWTDITNATDSLLTINATTADNGKTYRAVWSNTENTVFSEVATLTVNAAIIASVSGKTSAACSSNNGSVTISASGGNAPYKYSLNSGAYQTGNTFNNLSPDTYSVTVTDAAGCSSTINGIVIVSTSPVSVRATTAAASSCKDDGSITLSGAGGKTPYTFSLDGVQFSTVKTFTGLAAGSYTGYAKDAKGCVGSLANIVVNTVAPVSVRATTAAASSCKDDGSITLSGAGGKTPYTFSLNGVQFSTVKTFTGLAAGSYTGYAKDAKGCVGSLANIVVNTASPVSVRATTAAASSCKDDGSITLSGAGGKTPYTFSLNGVQFSTVKTFTGLAAGSYTGYAKDAKGCVGSLANIVVARKTFTSSVTRTNVSCKGGSNGTITISKAGGVSPYTYSLDGVHFQTSNKFINLTAGVYTSTVKDAKGCTATVTGITITEPATPCNNNLITENFDGRNLRNDDNDLVAFVSPNPSVSEFTLSVKGNNKESIEIRVADIYGKVIYSTKGTVSQTFHFGNNFSAGTYVVEIRQGINRKVLKVVKQ